MLQVPDPASIQVLSERSTSDACAVAVTVVDADGDRYLVIRTLIQEAGEWRRQGGSEGIDRTITSNHDPYLPLDAHANAGRFFAGGRVHSTALDVARARLVWGDGYELNEEVENGVVLFLGARDSLEPATVEFLDQAGRVIGRHPAVVDEPPTHDVITVDLVRVRSKEQFIERVLAAAGVPENLRTANWDAFEEQAREADRHVLLRNLDLSASDLKLGVEILDRNELLAKD
jgi:hypothetical protein